MGREEGKCERKGPKWIFIVSSDSSYDHRNIYISLTMVQETVFKYIR